MPSMLAMTSAVGNVASSTTWACMYTMDQFLGDILLRLRYSASPGHMGYNPSASASTMPRADMETGGRLVLGHRVTQSFGSSAYSSTAGCVRYVQGDTSSP